MKIIDMTCPKCGAAMKADLDEGKAVCEYCGYHFLIQKKNHSKTANTVEAPRSYSYYEEKRKAENEAKIKAEKSKKAKTVIIISIAAFIIIAAAIIFGGVREAASPKINPFDYIEISFRGIDGKGELVFETLETDEVILSDIDFTFSKERYLNQGEKISVTAQSYSYRLSETEKVYTVEGLDEYLKDLKNIPEEAFELIHSQALSYLDINLYRAEKYMTEIKPVKLFLLTDEDKENFLYDVFEVSYNTNSGSASYYVVVRFDEVVISNKEQISVNLSYGSASLGNLIHIQSANYIWGYGSVDELRTYILTHKDTYMVLKELDLVN